MIGSQLQKENLRTKEIGGKERIHRKRTSARHKRHGVFSHDGVILKGRSASGKDREDGEGSRVSDKS